MVKWVWQVPESDLYRSIAEDGQLLPEIWWCQISDGHLQIQGHRARPICLTQEKWTPLGARQESPSLLMGLYLPRDTHQDVPVKVLSNWGNRNPTVIQTVLRNRKSNPNIIEKDHWRAMTECGSVTAPNLVLYTSLRCVLSALFPGWEQGNYHSSRLQASAQYWEKRRD